MSQAVPANSAPVSPLKQRRDIAAKKSSCYGHDPLWRSTVPRARSNLNYIIFEMNTVVRCRMGISDCYNSRLNRRLMTRLWFRCLDNVMNAKFTPPETCTVFVSLFYSPKPNPTYFLFRTAPYTLFLYSVRFVSSVHPHRHLCAPPKEIGIRRKKEKKTECGVS